MRILVYLISLEIIAVSQASKQRSVNVALETVLEFDGKDDIDFIDTLQNFLRKLKTTIVQNRAAGVHDTKYLDDGKEEQDKQFVFTDILAETVSVLKSYNDDDLKMFFRALDREIKMWQTRKEFYDKLGFGTSIHRKLETLQNYPVDELRRKLNSLSEKLNFNKRDGNGGFFADVLNYFYKNESKTKLLTFLNNLKLYKSKVRRNIIDLKSIIRNGILSIIEPFLNLNSTVLNDINKMYYKFATNHSDPKDLEKYFLQHINRNESKPENSRQKNKFYQVINGNEILDYIEDQIRVIDEHFTTKGFVKKTKLKSKANRFRTTGTTHKYIRTTRLKKKKTKQSSLGKLTKKPSKKKTKKYINIQVTKDTNAIDDGQDRRPVLINLTSSEDSDLKSVEQYVLSTSKLPLNQKRYKKTTRRRQRKFKQNIFRTTKKSRKAFKTTSFSAVGLSIEHFGSLFGSEYHRKSNRNDTFKDTVSMSSVPATSYDFTSATDGAGVFFKKVKKKDNAYREIDEYNHDGTKNVSEIVEENTKVNKAVTEKSKLVTESIQIKGNIIIENPTEVPNLQIKSTTLKPVNNLTTRRNFNVSIVTKYLNLKPMYPTIVLRHQDMKISDETDATTPRVSTGLDSTLKTGQTANFNVTKSKIAKVITKATEDKLENEIEGIMDKYNASTIPVEFENFVNGVQKDNGENKKVKDQIQADFAKLFAPSTTKSKATNLFTDPFDDIDNVDDVF